MPNLRDVLHLLDDGTAVLVVNDQELKLREPLIKEWRGFIQDFTEAERRVIMSVSQLRATLGDDEITDDMDPSEHPTTQGAAYATVLCRIIRTLSEDAISLDPGDLPAWCGMPEVIVALEHHWTHVPLAIGSQPAKMVPHAKVLEAVGIQTVQSDLLERLSQAGLESTQS